jgi:hypothetical protein
MDHWLMAQLSPEQRESVLRGDVSLDDLVRRDIELVRFAKQSRSIQNANTRDRD